MNSPVEINADTILLVAEDPLFLYSSRKISFSSAEGYLDKILIKARMIFSSLDFADLMV